MGRNRRAAQQEAEAASPTLEATIVLARSDVLAVLARLHELWEDIYAPDVAHREGSEREHRPRSAQTGSPALWLQPSKVQRVYLDVTAEVARAHWELGQNTEVPEFWTYLAEVPALTGDLAPTVDVSVLRQWTLVLNESLEWLQTQDDLRPPEVHAIMLAASHIHSARERIDKLFPPHIEKRRCIRPGCKGADGKPRVLGRTDGKVCAACRQAIKRAKDAEEAERRDELTKGRKGLRKAS